MRPRAVIRSGRATGARAIATLCWLGALGLTAAACAPPKVSLARGPREYVAGDYESVLKQWTRERQLIVMSELDDLLTATATYESWDFRWAYVIRYAEDYRLTVDQRTSQLKRSLAEADREHHFYVALYTKKHKWADLTSDDPAWIVRLIDNTGNETAPSEIQLIKRPGAIERTYFPYTNPWRIAHRIRFPAKGPDGKPSIAPDAEWFGLRFAGPQGNQQLVWEVER